jgi:aminoglycoside phosphotransferase (APT) family kinase protein
VKMLRAFARAQAAIYDVQWPEQQARQLAAPSDLGPFGWHADRLGAARREILARNLRPLLPLVDWLEEHRGLIADEPDVLIHGDFHPLNVFIDGTAVCGVIDWGAGGFANRHEDMGWTSLLFATATSPDPKEDKKLAPFRTIARKVYLGFLWKSADVNRAQLRYGEVYAGLRWLLVFLPSYLPDAGEPLLNPDAIAFTTPLYVRRVRRFLEERTKLTLGIL